MKKIILLIFICAVSLTSTAIDVTHNSSKHHIGLHAGAASGLGFSYRYWPGRLGFQVTGIPIFRSGSDVFISSGLSALFVLRDNQQVDLFAYLSGHMRYRKNKYFLVNPQTTQEYIYNSALGLGLNISFLEKLNLSLQAGYGIFDLSDDFRTTISGEIGLYYSL